MGDLSRREFVIGGLGVVGGLALGSQIPAWTGWPGRQNLVVNDLHSQINQATVKRIEHPKGLDDLLRIINETSRNDEHIAISASRHAMGGQQFLKGGVLIDTRGMDKVLDFDAETGLVEVEAGIEWPELVRHLLDVQNHAADAWSIPVKQTGADRLSLGGAISANAHGRSLTKGPFVTNIESLRLVLASGEIVNCSRSENAELFSLVIGGYGLFGVIHSVVLRLVRREIIEREVVLTSADNLPQDFQKRIDEGYTLGDFQYVTDESSPDFLSRGVFSCYRPVPRTTQIPKKQESVSMRAWQELVYLAHKDKARAFKLYSDFYLRTTGQVYWSDQSQLGAYDDGYHKVVDRRMGTKHPGSEMITEVNVPREQLPEFLKACAAALREEKANVIYGTVRLIEKDDETFLNWAKGQFACVIFNLHMEHTEEGLAQAAQAFRRLIDLANERQGSYYLTYHRWATQEQVLAAYPQFPQFLELKRFYDQSERFQSDWYQHYRAMFA